MQLVAAPTIAAENVPPDPRIREAEEEGSWLVAGFVLGRRGVVSQTLPFQELQLVHLMYRAEETSLLLLSQLHILVVLHHMGCSST